MTNNKYGYLRNVAFIALMCASSFAYGMEEDPLQSLSARLRGMSSTQLKEEEEKSNSIKNIVSNEVAIQQYQWSLRELKDQAELRRLQITREFIATETANYQARKSYTGRALDGILLGTENGINVRHELRARGYNG